jgi:hypothetical protein
MKAQFVYENLNFERGLDPKESMGIGDSEFRDFLKLSDDELMKRITTNRDIDSRRKEKIISALVKKNEGTKKADWEKKIKEEIIERDNKINSKISQITEVMKEFAKRNHKRMKTDNSDPEYFYAGINDSNNDYFLSIGLNPSDDNKFHLASTDLHNPNENLEETDTIEEAMEWIENWF